MKLFFFFILIALFFGCSDTKSSKQKPANSEQFSCYFFFISDCPASRNNLPKIEKLHQQYSESVEFIGIVSDPYLDTSKLNNTLSEFNISFHVKSDTNLFIAKQHGASITPEVFLYNSSGDLIYSGSVDNYYFDLGKHRKQITENYLAQAIASGISGNIVKVKRNEPIGCTINFDTKSEP